MSWVEKLRKMKKSSGQTTKQIAEGSGLPEPTLEKIFAGKTDNPRLSTIHQLVHYLGHTLDDLNDEQPLASDPMRIALLDHFDQLNQEGKELLVDYADTLTASGKYIKTHQAGLGSSQA